MILNYKAMRRMPVGLHSTLNQRDGLITPCRRTLFTGRTLLITVENNMTKIDQKIVSYSVVKEDQPVQQPQEVVHQERMPVLSGKTYKIPKSPLSDSALYITLNEHEGRPFEIFINSKDTKHYQWVIALTRVISAVFRKGGDCIFLIEELKSIYDPNGGYFKKGKYIPSLVAEIGNVLEQHFIYLGIYQKDDSLAVAAQAMVKEKLPKTEGKGQRCSKCGDFAVVLLDNCLTCMSCGDSKCG